MSPIVIGVVREAFRLRTVFLLQTLMLPSYFRNIIMTSGINEGNEMKTSTKILVYLVFIALADGIIPVPIAALLLIYVLYQKPLWFKEIVLEIYRS